MKTLVILLMVALAFALVVVCLLYVALVKANELNKRTCGKCDFCDKALNHCWMRGISVGTEDEACLSYREREGENEDTED